MPKHLYTLPAGTVLPDPAGSPEGYPFLLESGAGATLTQELYAIKAGAYAKLAGGGGGGGSVGFGPYLPATGPDRYAFEADDAALPTGVSVSSFSAIDDTTNNGGLVNVGPVYAGTPGSRAGLMLKKAWRLGTPQPQFEQQYGHAGLAISIPYPQSGQGGLTLDDPGPGAFRFSFRYTPPSDAPQGSYFVVLVTDAYDPALIARVNTVFGERAYEANPENPQAGNGYDFSSNQILWACGANYSDDYTVTVPPGASQMTFLIYATPNYKPPVGYNPILWNGHITDIQVRPVNKGTAKGQLFVEGGSQRTWVYDASPLPASRAGTGQAEDGAGWYPATPPVLADDRGHQFGNWSTNNSRLHFGQMLFSYAADLAGNPFGGAKQDKTPAVFGGEVPAVSKLGFVDIPILPADPTLTYTSALVETPGLHNGHLGAPTPGATSPGGAVGGHLPNSTLYYYVLTSVDSAGRETTPSSEVSVTTYAGGGGGTNRPLIPFAGVPGAASYKLYRGTVPGGESDTGLVVLDTGDVNYSFNDTSPLVSPNGTAPPTVDTTLGIYVANGQILATGGIATFLHDGGAADCNIELECGYLYSYATQPRPLWSVRFRASGVGDYWKAQLDPRAATPAWALINVVGGVETVVASGTYSFSQPINLAVKVVGDQVRLATAGAGPGQIGGFDQVLHDDFAAATHTLTTAHAAATQHGFTLPDTGAAFRYQDLTSTSRNPNGTMVRLPYGTAKKGCFVVPPGLDSNSGGRLVAYTAYSPGAFVNLTGIVAKRRDYNSPFAEFRPARDRILLSGFKGGGAVVLDDTFDATVLPLDEIDLFVKVPALYNLDVANEVAFTLYYGGPLS